MVVQILVAIIALLLGFGGGYYVKSGTCSQTPKVAITQTVVPTAMPTPIPTNPVANLTPTPPLTEKVFDNYNIAGVSNQPTADAVFILTSARRIYTIQDYHWNNASGKTPGTIGLESEDGKVYGAWQAVGAPGQGGVPDAYWTVYPDVELPAGTYTIVDSDPASWAQNSGSKGVGMSQVFAVK